MVRVLGAFVRKHPDGIRVLLIFAFTMLLLWNSYDIFFEAPRFEGEKLVKPAYVTVVHNGVLVHHHRSFKGPAAHRINAPYVAHGEDSLSLQDHGHPVRYRNIWIRRLKAE